MLFKRQKSNLTPTFNAIQRMGLCIGEKLLVKGGFQRRVWNIRCKTNKAEKGKS